MMMALGALKTETQEELGGVLQLVLQRPHLAVPSHRRILGDVARGGHDFTDELIVGLVAAEALTNPIVEGVGAVRLLGIGALISEESAPLAGEIVSVILGGQEAFNDRVALARGRVLREGLKLRRSGDAAGEIDGHAAKEGRVVSHLAGRHAHLLELLEDQFIHHGANRRQLADWSAQRDGATESRHFALIPDHYGHFARLVKDLHSADGIRGGHVLVVGLIQRTTSDILDRPVGVVSAHHQLLLAVETQGAFGREDADPFHRGRLRIADRHALADPTNHKAVVVGIGINALTAAVRKLRGTLGEQKASLWSGREQAAAAGLLHEVLVIFRRFKSQQRKSKSILPGRLAMTAAAVASGLGEDGNDLIGEMDGRRGAGVLDAKREGGFRAVGSHSDQGAGAVGQRRHATRLVHGGEGGGSHLPLDLASEVPFNASRLRARH